MSRRSRFFLVVAVVCLVLLAPTPAEFRWVNLLMAGIALFWCVLMTAEDVSRARAARRAAAGAARPSAGDREPGPADPPR